MNDSAPHPPFNQPAIQGTAGSPKKFAIGPDKEGDLRQFRPYFLIPFTTRPKQFFGRVRRMFRGIVTQRGWRIDSSPETVQQRIYDWVPGYVERAASSLQLPEVSNRQALVKRLRVADEQSDPVAHFVKRNLSTKTLQLVERFDGSMPGSLDRRLVIDLNRLLQRADFYDEQRFVGVSLGHLSDDERAQLAGGEKVVSVSRLNRKLLHAAFPDEILPPKRRVTDVYILSHGWHRNFYSAIAAYDRLVSRMFTLLHRGRLPAEPEYLPLFLTVHWHSDPGEDYWEDDQGRRKKESFLHNIERVFERPLAQVERQRQPEQRFTAVFEEIFELFSQMCAPGAHALSNPMFEKRSKKLADRIGSFEMKDAPGAGNSQKAAAIWRCYHEAKPHRVLLDQHQPPREFQNPVVAIWNSIRFVAGLCGLAFAIWILIQVVLRLVAIQSLPTVAPAEGGSSSTVLWVALGMFVAFVVSLGVFFFNIETHSHTTSRRGLRSTCVMLAWVYLQCLFSVWLVLLLLLTYSLGWFLRMPFLYDERIGRRNQAITEEQTSEEAIGRKRLYYTRYLLAKVARIPLSWLKDSIPKDSQKLNSFAHGLDSYAAFWEMQMRAAMTGMHTARFVANLFADEKLASHIGDARIHLLGHSFGGLVVSNAVRHLALDRAIAPVWAGRKIHTLCLVQGALGSAWFKNESKLFDLVEGSVTSIYSNYDSANWFYYPVGNRGRYSAGAVGLCDINQDITAVKLPLDYWYHLKDDHFHVLKEQGVPEYILMKLAGLRNEVFLGEEGMGRALREVLDPSEMNMFGEAIQFAAWNSDNGLFASLTGPPDLAEHLHSRYPRQQRPWLLNLDASRLIHEGSLATGGGHNDIFKDDLIHLTWAATRL